MKRAQTRTYHESGKFDNHKGPGGKVIRDRDELIDMYWHFTLDTFKGKYTNMKMRPEELTTRFNDILSNLFTETKLPRAVSVAVRLGINIRLKKLVEKLIQEL